MKQPQILVTQSSMPSIHEYIQEITSIFDSKWLTNNGEKHQQFESDLKSYLGLNNLTLFVNGHLALYTAIKSFDFPNGSEIITTPFSFASTTHAIVQNSLKPVFCDINPEDYTIDANKIESLITEKTVAILPVHVYGHICDIKKIEEIARKHSLKVIYDAAHVFGVKYNNKSIAEYGDISMFSFHATKVFNSIEGGALVYQSSDLEPRLNLLKNFGIADAENVIDVGTNAKMNEFAAAMGICNLRHLDSEIKKRSRVYNHYIERLRNIDGIKLPRQQKDTQPNYAYLPVIFNRKVFGKNRDEIFELLVKNNIFARKYFYPLISDYACYSKQYDSSKTPVAKNISNNILTLPLYADLSISDVDRICDIILGR